MSKSPPTSADNFTIRSPNPQPIFASEEPDRNIYNASRLQQDRQQLFIMTKPECEA